MRFNDFDLYKDLLKEKAGLRITPDKSYLLDSRLNPVAAKWGYPNVVNLTHALRGIADPGLIKDVIEAMLSRNTCFMNDSVLLHNLSRVLIPKIGKARKASKSLRIWHAACCTGQEPYSLAIYLREHPDILGHMKPDILATDLSSTCLEMAKSGQFRQNDVQIGLSARNLLKYFDQKDGHWIIKPDIKAMVRFQYANLLDHTPGLGEFDIIFCRNVFENMDWDVQAKAAANLARHMAGDGFLILGADEEVPRGFDIFKPVPGCAGIYSR